MSTVAWVMILGSILVFRAVSKGRVMNIGEDISDAFLALLQGDTGQLTEILARTGDSTTPDQGELSAEDAAALRNVGKDVGSTAGKLLNTFPTSALATAVVALGSKAKGYKFTATGPDYYDCSGLVWRGCQKVGYKGGRFTTFDIQARKGFEKVTGRTDKTVQIGDIVVWPTHHMGVVTGPDLFYSARSVQSGIKQGTISGFRGSAPIYLRYVG